MEVKVDNYSWSSAASPLEKRVTLQPVSFEQTGRFLLSGFKRKCQDEAFSSSGYEAAWRHASKRTEVFMKSFPFLCKRFIVIKLWAQSEKWFWFSFILIFWQMNHINEGLSWNVVCGSDGESRPYVSSLHCETLSTEKRHPDWTSEPKYLSSSEVRVRLDLSLSWVSSLLQLLASSEFKHRLLSVTGLQHKPPNQSNTRKVLFPPLKTGNRPIKF